MIVGVDLCRITMDVNDLLVTRRIDLHGIEFLHVIPDTQNHICLVEAKIGVVVYHESYRTERVWMVVRKDSLTHESRRDRDVKTLGETDKCFTRVIAHGTVSRKHHRILRSFQDFCSTRYLSGRRRGVAHHIDL